MMRQYIITGARFIDGVSAMGEECPKRAARYGWQYAVSAVILVFGIIISAVLYVLLRNQEQSRLIYDFNRAAQDRIAAAKNSLQFDFLTLQAVRSFYEESEKVTRDEFRNFVNPLIKDRLSIHAVEWAPRMPGGRFPVLFGEQAGRGVDGVGYDLAAIPVFRGAIETARDTGELTLSAKTFKLPNSECPDLWAFLPVYYNTPTETVAQRRRGLMGVVVGILSPEWIVGEAANSLMPAGVDVELLDTTIADHPQLLYSHQSRMTQDESDGIAEAASNASSAIRRAKSFNVAGRRWTIVCTASPPFIAMRVTWYPQVTAIGFFLLNIFLVLYLFGITGRNVRTARLAERLAAANRQLQKEVIERQKAEATLYASETKYKTLFDTSYDAILLSTSKGKFIEGNRAAAAAFGCENQKDFYSLEPAAVSPKYQPDGDLSSQKAARMIAIAVKEGFHRFEWVYNRLNGVTVLVDVTLTRIELDGEAYLLTTIRDITEQRQAEEALKKSERRLRLFAGNVEDLLWTMDVSGWFTYFSPSVEKMLGFTWEEGMRITFEDVMTPDSVEISRKILERINAQIEAKEQVETVNIELELLRSDGSTLWAEITAGAMYDESGKPIGMLGVTRDITDRKQMENELREAKDAAEAATQAKSQFLASMSHEIRTPMTAILGYADLLMDPKVSASAQHNYLATIRRSGEHLLMLINDILDLSKIEAGKMALDVGQCNIISLLADVSSVVRPQAESNGVSFSLEYEGAIPETIHTDSIRLRQAITNLAGNAVKFTKEGSVRIAVSFVEKEELCGGVPAICFRVIDTGIGIREEVLSRLFKPFSQGDTSIVKEYGGSGLGLAISRNISRLLNGDLTATSVWGEGSTFTLTIPTGSLDGVEMLDNPSELEREAKNRQWQETKESLRGIRILLAEDGYDNRELIKAVLRKAGAAIETAENGRLAVEAANQDAFDLILMDMNMPEMDGYEATRVLRDQGYKGPILALTANAMVEDRERCQLAGCDEFLTKPIDRMVLIQSIARYVKGVKNVVSSGGKTSK